MVWRIALIGILGLGTLGAFAYYQHQRFEYEAKLAEGSSNTATLARGVVDCAERTGALPGTTPWAPPTPPRATTYMSTPSDWAPFACAGFTVKVPQRYQYRWVKDSPTTGHVEARADFDGDGVLATVRLDVSFDGDAGQVSSEVHTERKGE